MKYAMVRLCLVLFLVIACLVPDVFANFKDVKTLDQALKAKVPIVVKLGSDSCYPCRQMKPVLAQLSVEQKGKMVFLDLDIYKNRDLAQKFKVRVIPTLIYYDRSGKVKGKTEGAMSKEQLMKTIKDLKL